jgi:hypothetical protein
MYSSAEIAKLDKLNFPFDYAIKGKSYKSGKEILELREKFKGSQKAFRSKVEKADRIEFYALQVLEGKPIEFQPDERKLNNRLIKFLDGYYKIAEQLD